MSDSRFICITIPEDTWGSEVVAPEKYSDMIFNLDTISYINKMPTKVRNWEGEYYPLYLGTDRMIPITKQQLEFIEEKLKPQIMP